jgi:PmbA protein
MSMNNRISPVLDEDFLQDVLARALECGATDAQARAEDSRALTVDVRNGALQNVQNAESTGLQLTAYVGRRKATVGTNDFSRRALSELIERVTSMARIAPEDAFCGLAPRELVSRGDDAHLELFDAREMNPAQLEAWALELDATARAMPGITQCEGAPVRVGWARNLHVASNGLARRSEGSFYSAGVSVIAEGDGQKEVGSAHRIARWREDLPAMSDIGIEAGRIAAAQLGSRKLASCKAPVIFDRRVAMNLIGPLLGAISGAAIARGTSFLKNALGRKVFADSVDIVDDPFLPRALGSRAVDQEGVVPQTRKIIDGGVLTTWLLDCPTARQLKLETTGHAGGVSNLTVAPGRFSQRELMAQADSGLLVTTLFGPSLNPNSGDWSLGVAGFWFESGEIAFPVSEVTVAGRLPDLYPALIVGSDLEIRDAANAPSLLVPQMSIGGR